MAVTLGPDDLSRLDKYDVVLVTGPQRSGTNFVTMAIAADTDLNYVPESAFNSTWAQAWWTLVQTSDNVAVHCPGMCRFVHMFGTFDEVAVVMVRRPVADIVASQERIGWEWEPYELMLYDRHAYQGPIAEVKYECWDQLQKERIENAFEVNYDDMHTHPLWVPKEEREGWDKRQIFREGAAVYA